MSNFEFATAGRILFGEGKREAVFDIGPALGNRALIVTGSDPLRAAWVRKGFDKIGIWNDFFSVPEEPTVALVEAGAGAAREAKCQFVIAVGGGSAIDAGKAIAALATNSGGAHEYLEVIGKARPLEVRPLPFIAVPTTAGTGAEVTRNAVLASPEHQLKVSLRHPWMLPMMAIVDPELTYDLPPAATAFSGLDALTQL
ncbi:MAG: iron-containing alcohol dehydrogenase, partial [Limisphaerales bacterium]